MDGILPGHQEFNLDVARDWRELFNAPSTLAKFS